MLRDQTAVTLADERCVGNAQRIVHLQAGATDYSARALVVNLFSTSRRPSIRQQTTRKARGRTRNSTGVRPRTSPSASIASASAGGKFSIRTHAPRVMRPPRGG